MSLINFSNIQDSTTIDAADVNSPLNTIYNDYNGNIDSTNIKDGALDSSTYGTGSVTNAALAADAVTDAKLIYGKVRTRQGGSDTSWIATGTTTYDYSSVDTFIEVGASKSTNNTTTLLNGWYVTSEVTVTFPVAFSQIPVVVLNTSGDHAVATATTITASNFKWRGRCPSSVAADVTALWVAIGQ